MVWNGSQTITRVSENVIEITSDTFDADGEIGTTLDIFTIGTNLLNHATNLSIYVTATHATAVTDIVDIAVQGSYFGTQWADVTDGTTTAEITDADVDNGGSASEDSAEVTVPLSTVPYRYYRVLCTTVGVGNTLTMKWRLSNVNYN